MSLHDPDRQVHPSLSVVVNNYNHERFVGEAIQSVLALAMPLAEVVVVDDGSQDASRETISRYLPKVQTLFQANTGQLQACLNALALTTGDYVYFLDADDRVLPAFADRLPAALAGRPAKVQFRLASIDGEGAPLDSVFPAYPKRYGAAAAVCDMEAWGLYLCPPTSGNVFRRDVLERLAATRVDYESAIDGIALYLAPLMGEVVTLAEPLANYRLHGSNIHQQHVLSAPRLRKEIARTTARWTHLHDLTGRPTPFQGGRAPGMIGEWSLMAALAEGRRPRWADLGDLLRGLWRSHQTLKTKLALSLWGAALVGLPRAAARTLCEWRLSPLNRPAWLNRRLGRRPLAAAAAGS